MSDFEKGLEIKSLYQLKLGSRYFITTKSGTRLWVLDSIQDMCFLEPNGEVFRDIAMFSSEDGLWCGITNKNIESYKVFAIKKPSLVDAAL